MRLDKKILKRPRCKACGERLFQIHGFFSSTPSPGKIPSHCPQCGAELSLNIKNRLRAHDNFLLGLRFLPLIGALIAFLIVVIVINL